MEKVLNTTELLEAILVELPPKDLLLFQRVNRKFQATVQVRVYTIFHDRHDC